MTLRTLSIEKAFDPFASPPTYLFSLTNSGAESVIPVPPAFDGDFSKFFTGPSAAWQPHVALTYAATLLAAGTTPPVITLSLPPTVTTPIRIEVVSGGALGAWTGKISYDSPRAGGGTFAQTFTSAATVDLTGAGLGGRIAIAAGAAATDNVWRACKSQLSDTTGRNHHLIQATAGKQAIVTPGVAGHVGVEFDGVDDESAADLFQVDTSVGGPAFLWYVGRRRTWQGASRQIFSGIPYLRSGGAEPQETVFAGQTSGTLATNTFGLIEVACNNQAATDYIRAGAAAAVAGNNGTNGVAAGIFVGSSGGASFSSIELLAMIVCPSRPTDAQMAAARAQAKLFWTGLDA